MSITREKLYRRVCLTPWHSKLLALDTPRCFDHRSFKGMTVPRGDTVCLTRLGGR